jgi:(S)-sulfolactate dehydrogenase
LLGLAGNATSHAALAGRLAGAAIDVFSRKPLADAPNLILTPHIAKVTLEFNIRISALIAERVASRLRSNG